MVFDKESTTCLVPSGLIIMFYLPPLPPYRILRHPETTVIGYENHNKLAWVERMLQATNDETSLALTVISSSMSASSNLASISITLSSLIGTWVGSTSAAGNRVFTPEVVYGDTSQATSWVKYVSLLVCFLVAFTCFIHSARYFVHASYLISTLDSDVPLAYVQRAVVRGGNFWSLGLRALYFATVLLMWIFGPIPMFTCSVFVVIVLHFLDSNSLPLHHHIFRKKGTSTVGRRRSPELVATFADNPVLYSSAAVAIGLLSHGPLSLFSLLFASKP
ncbi:hypothetical protein HPP92_008153 [Vanilla planifolia]|uniref:Uncharacterized protein n=1 Tax=Vanilla planifolia TaxID=51239 RepID=A0A835RNS5_VANPL|nr:hypothetical protein HPP92_008153 [Vanilla planifolia]